MKKEENKNKLKENEVKKPYQKPKVTSEKPFESRVLQCDKCDVGPSGEGSCVLIGEPDVS